MLLCVRDGHDSHSRSLTLYVLGCCDVWTGHSKDLLSRLPNRYGGPGQLQVSAVFMDQKGVVLGRAV